MSPLSSRYSNPRTVKTLYIATAVTVIGLATVASVLYFGFLSRTPPPSGSTGNGELIYSTGIDSAGVRISFTDGPIWMYMMGGSCVSCHGPTGAGGTYPMMCRVEAADVRYTSLLSEGYNDTTIRRTITQGLDESGEPMDACMPRWQMSATDLNDVVAYLKELG